MLLTIVIILVILWALGAFAFPIGTGVNLLWLIILGLVAYWIYTQIKKGN